jgi:putative ATP-dependent endonuclease of OLD family
MENTQSAAGSAAYVRRLTIERFRGIKELTWYPTPGVNIILGGGDVGKTTILDAVALLLNPTNSVLLSDADYFSRAAEEEFCIEAVMTLPASTGISHESKTSWPWEWDGKDLVVPDPDQPPTTPSDPVYRIRVRGTAEFDLAYEIVHPNEDISAFGVTVRRRIGLVRLGGDDRNDRDLRLVQGSALDRLVGDRTLRSRVAQSLAANSPGVVTSLSAEAKEALAKLETSFKGEALPTDLSIGITGGQGLSLTALLGLTAKKGGADLPLASWGSGTRRLAALEIAAQHEGELPVIVVDEIERGLEPYRQRALVARVQGRGSQVFVTTHSAVVLRALSTGAIWYLDALGNIGSLERPTAKHRTSDPEAYLARFPIIAEGATEAGFVSTMVQRLVTAEYLERGIHVSDGGGNAHALQIMDALSAAGLTVAGFVDDEGDAPERWGRVKTRLGDLLMRWEHGCIETNVIPLIQDDELEEFMTPPETSRYVIGDRLRTLADRLGLQGKELAHIRTEAANRSGGLHGLIIEAASGKVPSPASLSKEQQSAWKKHGQTWFKTYDGGCELADKVLRFGLVQELGTLDLFLKALRELTVGTAEETSKA